VSASEATVARDAPLADPRWRLTAFAGAALLAGASIALAGGSSGAAAAVVASIGAAVAVWLLAPQALRAFARHRSLVLLVALGVLAVLWVAIGVRRVNTVPSLSFMFPSGPVGAAIPDRPVSYSGAFGGSNPFFGQPVAVPVGSYIGVVGADWPWRLGHLALLPLLLTLLAAGGGLVLIADGVRVQLGLSPRQRVPWRLMTAPRERRGQIAWRAVPGVLLIGWAAFLAIGIIEPYIAGDRPLEAAVLILIGGWVAVLIASPLLVGYLLRVDRDKAGTAREEERQRFAAHLHDSVLQTLALVQRQAHDPVAVVRLARRQEHALRAWMAGEAELVSETLVSALRDVVAVVEDENEITIELSAIGDRPLDPSGEALVAAVREALRNAAHHASGAAVLVFCEISPASVEVFVRDEGPGFDVDAVPAERRGIRDAVIGRMASVGGRAAIDSTPGEGTEVTLHLGAAGGGR
jgi:hypothetical protein